MKRKEQLKKYHQYFDADAPEPPDHLLPVIIEMMESGEMEKVLKEHGEEIQKLSEELEKLGDNSLNKENPLWKQIA